MSKVRLQAPSAEDLGLSPGEPIVAEILDHDLDLVKRVSLQTGVAQDVEVPGNETYIVRLRVPDGQDIIAKATSAAEEGRFAAAKFLRKVAALIEPQAVTGMEQQASGGGLRGAVKSVLEKIAGSAEEGTVTIEAPSSVSQHPPDETTIRGSDLFDDASAVVWAREGDAWRHLEPYVLEPLGNGRFGASLPNGRMYAVQVGGPNLPWRIVLLPPTKLEIDVVLKPSHSQLDVGVGVKVHLKDPRAEATLRYNEAGAWQSARTLAETSVAEELLRAKEVDVTGAVVGAYTLLRTGEYAHLHDWPNNLANMYPWLPDPAVIHAWQLLEEPGAPQFEVAQDRLLQAERAGLPIFSEGLRRLYDGLILFRDDPETPDVAEVDEAVRGSTRTSAPPAFSTPTRRTTARARRSRP